MAAVAEQLGQLGAAARAARGEADRLQESLTAASTAVQADRDALAELEHRLVGRRGGADDERAGPGPRDVLAVAASNARQAEIEARLTVRTGEERARALAGRAEALERAAAEERAARGAPSSGASAVPASWSVAGAVAGAVAVVLARLELSLQAAATERATAESERTAADGELAAVRIRARELAGEIEQLTDSVHRDEMARAEQRLRIEALEQRALEELGVDPETLVVEYGPDQLVPAVPARRRTRPDEPTAATPVPYVRAEQEKRARAAERALALLGRVNPLALEEFAALEERHQFLTEQLEDLKKTRRDLLDIVREVDERVEQVFTAAYDDTAREFEARLRPALPRRRGTARAHRPVGHAHHRHRGRGAAARQEGQAAVAAVRRRALADGGRAAGRDLQGPAEPVLRHGRGRGGARRHQPGAAARRSSRSCASPAS